MGLTPEEQTEMYYIDRELRESPAETDEERQRRSDLHVRFLELDKRLVT